MPRIWLNTRRPGAYHVLRSTILLGDEGPGRLSGNQHKQSKYCQGTTHAESGATSGYRIAEVLRLKPSPSGKRILCGGSAWNGEGESGVASVGENPIHCRYRKNMPYKFINIKWVGVRFRTKAPSFDLSTAEVSFLRIPIICFGEKIEIVTLFLRVSDGGSQMRPNKITSRICQCLVIS